MVDDDPDVLWAITDTIEFTHGKCVTAGSAAEALDLYRNNNDIKIVITDIWMPDHDGEWLISNIRNLGKTRDAPPVFIKMTGHIKERPDNWEGSGSDVVEFLVKPFNTSEVIDAINYARRYLTLR